MVIYKAIPDVSAQSDLFKVFIGGQAFLIGGTSASSPTFTGFVALLNDVRLKAGQPSLGFLNPFLYSKGFAGLNDITSGNNAGCGTPGFNVSMVSFSQISREANMITGIERVGSRQVKMVFFH
jgi:tripeptidyl-peptidase-1